jgi:hypothetical protein
MKSVIVYGPQGCGKTLNAEQIRKALGLKKVLDEWIPEQPFPKDDTLVLTEEYTQKWGHKVLSFDRLMKRFRLTPVKGSK